MVKKKDVVDLLLKKGLVTQEQVDEAGREIERTGLRIEQALEKLGFITEEKIANARAVEMDVPYMDLTNYILDKELIKFIPEDLARKHNVLPLFRIGDSLTVAMVDPDDIAALDQVRRVSGIDAVEPVLTTEKGIQKILNSYYGAAESVQQIIKSMDDKGTIEKQQKGLAELAEEAPVVKLVNVIIMQAVKNRASDIHLEPEERILRIRYRIDGILHEAEIVPKKLEGAVISRVKILSKMDIAESRKPQDGRIRLKLKNKDLDIRVSTFPTIQGENVVMRLLDRSSVLFGLKELGFSKEEFRTFAKLIQRPSGIILVTGPTGSGKTTTLYAALSVINSMEKNIVTIEDPVEYELPLIRQTPVNPKAGVTFANGLRNILRQDPDIIMVGEIRDKETSDIAIRAALTGHLVFSTLHTNDAPSALTRLINMGVEPFLISSSVIGVLAQRLVRIICNKCKEKYTPSGTVLENLGIGKKIECYRGKGCVQCKGTGFLGRIAIFELFIIDEEIKGMINTKKSAGEIRKKAVELGMKSLKENGLEKIKAGLASPDEVLKVTAGG
ncbi:MAG: ATPase, T2SS/T4P/T4SS family [Candidatus Omnitrophota bacterium]|nr:ATPase, T2SS/T4P/T4SS family [Candidatus Omnitrophota bacterium]